MKWLRTAPSARPLASPSSTDDVKQANTQIQKGFLFSASSLLDVAQQFKNDLCKCNFTVCHPTPAN